MSKFISYVLDLWQGLNRGLLTCIIQGLDAGLTSHVEAGLVY